MIHRATRPSRLLTPRHLAAAATSAAVVPSAPSPSPGNKRRLVSRAARAPPPPPPPPHDDDADAAPAAPKREQHPASFRGVFPVLPTPFLRPRDARCGSVHPPESLDLHSFRTAIRFMASAGVQGVTVCGVLGESDRLTDGEREVLVGTAVEVARELNDGSGGGGGGGGGRSSPPKLKICVGTSHAGTAAAAELSRTAMELGADAVLVSPTGGGPSSSSLPPSDASILGLFGRVADRCPDLPIILQDRPTSTGVAMSPRLIAQVASEVPTVRSVKLESTPTFAKIAQLRRIWNDDPNLAQPPGACTILAGLGGLYGGFELERDVDGFMTGFAFPEILVAMVRAARVGNYDRAHAIYARYLPLFVFESMPGETGVMVRKELYRRRGLFGSGHVRAPTASEAEASSASLSSGGIEEEGSGSCIEPILGEALDGVLRRSFGGGGEVDITGPLPSQILIPLPDERSRARQLSSIWYR